MAKDKGSNKASNGKADDKASDPSKVVPPASQPIEQATESTPPQAPTDAQSTPATQALAAEKAAVEKAPVIEQKPSETTSALYMPKPTEMAVWQVKDLPDAERTSMLGLNVRTVTVRAGETIAQAIDRELDMPEMMHSLINSDKSEQESNQENALKLVRYKKKPDWLPADAGVTLADGSFVTIGDGNRRTVGLSRLFRSHGAPGKKPREVDLVTTDAEGRSIRTTVYKTFDKVLCAIYDELTEEQFRHLQRQSFNRKNLGKGDILRIAVNVFRKDITLSEDELVNRVGATTFKQFYYSANDKDNPFHTGVQIARKCAKLPPDIAQAVVDKFNKVEGAFHLNDKQLRPLLKTYEADFGFWDRRVFNTTNAKFKDARFRPSMTTTELKELLDKMAIEWPEMGGGPSAGKDGSDRSDFLKLVWTYKPKPGATQQGSRGRQVGPVDLKDLKSFDAGLQETETTKRIWNALQGKADAIELKDMLELDGEFQTKARELMQAHAKDWYDAWCARVNQKQREKDAEVQKAKAAATAAAPKAGAA